MGTRFRLMSLLPALILALILVLILCFSPVSGHVKRGRRPAKYLRHIGVGGTKIEAAAGTHVLPKPTPATPAPAALEERDDADDDAPHLEIDVHDDERLNVTLRSYITPEVLNYITDLQNGFGVPSPLPVCASGDTIVYCFPDTSTRPGGLASDVFLFPSIRTFSCNDGDCMLSWCTCCAEQLQAKATLEGLSAEVVGSWTTTDCQSMASSCLHTRALETWINASNRHPDSNGTLDETVAQVTELQVPGLKDRGLKWYLVLNPVHEKAVVDVCGSRFHCSKCYYAKQSCAHVKAVKELVGSDVDVAAEADHDHMEGLFNSYYDEESGQLRIKAISKAPIPPMFSNGTRPARVPPVLSFMPINQSCVLHPVESDSIPVLSPTFPASAKCPKCNVPWCKATLVTSTAADKFSVLFDTQDFFRVRVQHRTCGCGNVLPYDGGDKGILNLNNRDLFTHDSLRVYSVEMTTAALPFYAFWKASVLLYTEHAPAPGFSAKDQKFLIGRRKKFQEAWVNFVALQPIPYEEAFQCKCPAAERNQCLIGDGIVLGTKKENSAYDVPWATPQDCEPVTGSMHVDRVLISNATLRQKLRRFFSRPNPQDKQVGLSSEDYTDLLSVAAMERSSAHCLSSYLNATRSEEIGGDTKFFSDQPSPVYHFIRSLLTDSPACSVMHHDVHDVVDLVSKGTPLLPVHLQLLAAKAPLLHKFILHELTAIGVSVAAASLLCCTLAKARAAHVPSASTNKKSSTAARQGQRSTPGPQVAGVMTWFRTHVEEFIRSGQYYPSLPVLRHVRRYTADQRSQGSGRTCTKYRNTVRALTPGLFVMHCVKCAACIGFHMMENYESPRTLFEWLYTRFLTPPAVVVYDNNCHVHAYCLNREPEWAAKTIFVIDKTHFKGHTGCSRGYDIASYPDLTGLNSQLAEQRNAKLAMLKAHMVYMTQPMFLIYLRFFLYVSNSMPKL